MVVCWTADQHAARSILHRGMFHNKNHLISTCYPRPSIVLQAQNCDLKHHSFIPFIVTFPPSSLHIYFVICTVMHMNLYTCGTVDFLWVMSYSIYMIFIIHCSQRGDSDTIFYYSLLIYNHLLNYWPFFSIVVA